MLTQHNALVGGLIEMFCSAETATACICRVWELNKEPGARGALWRDYELPAGSRSDQTAHISSIEPSHYKTSQPHVDYVMSGECQNKSTCKMQSVA